VPVKRQSRQILQLHLLGRPQTPMSWHTALQDIHIEAIVRGALDGGRKGGVHVHEALQHQPLWHMLHL
jgi:hypothetical protein